MLMPAIPRADLIELFSSIQGEGLLVGTRQAFLRLSGCNLDCGYCDTDYRAPADCQVETDPGSGEFEVLENPVTLETVTGYLNDWQTRLPRSHHSLSITGGEPLIHDGLLRSWLPELRRILPIYLETNGTLPEALEALIEHIDWIAMDIKLHSQTGERTDWDIHRRFLEIAAESACFVKLVVGAQTPDLELQLAGDLVSTVSKEIPLILQPVTVNERIGIDNRRLLEMQAVVADTHPRTRVIPQIHKFLNLF